MIETVRIVKGDKYATINKSDFNPEKHVLYGIEPEAEFVKEPEKPKAKKAKK